VATVLHLRLNLPDDTLAHLLGTSRSTIRRALTEIQDLLDQHEYHVEPVTTPPGLPARIPPYVPQTTGNTEKEIKKAC
jgi:Helix-turn-helix of DDE superfamily endonuclease